MEINFGSILEALDNVPYGTALTVDDLKKKLLHPDVTQKLINEAWKRELIANKDYPLKNEPHTTVPENISLTITIAGFELLNQIRTKKAIEQLNISIRKFNESSDRASNKIIELTYVVYVFTIIVAAIPLIDKILQVRNLTDPIYWIIAYFTLVISIAGVMVIYYKKRYENSLVVTSQNVSKK